MSVCDEKGRVKERERERAERGRIGEREKGMRNDGREGEGDGRAREKVRDVEWLFPSRPQFTITVEGKIKINRGSFGNRQSKSTAAN